MLRGTATFGETLIEVITKDEQTFLFTVMLIPFSHTVYTFLMVIKCVYL